MTRSWCLLLAACAAPVRPPPAAPLSHAAPATKRPPAGMFVADLIARRVDVGGGDDACTRVGCADRRAAPRTFEVLLAARTTRPRAPVVVLPGGPQPEAVTVAYCVGETGQVTSVRAPGAVSPRDRAYVESIRSWRFAPVFVDGKPITACSFLTFESR